MCERVAPACANVLTDLCRGLARAIGLLQELAGYNFGARLRERRTCVRANAAQQRAGATIVCRLQRARTERPMVPAAFFRAPKVEATGAVGSCLET